MQPKVSVVVPIYNTEKYLKQCVESILDQTLKDIEVILVDDGSPDRCGEIVDCLAHKDNRIKVVHQDNAGLGPARNSGIRASTGEYIGFVDSDDWIMPEMYERLYETAIQSKADIVVSGHCDICDGKVVWTSQHPLAGKTLRSGEEIKQIRKRLYGHDVNDSNRNAFPMSVCMSIYRRGLIEENNLRFRNILSEDTIFNLHAYKYAEVLSFTSHTDYRYRKEEQVSITHTFSEVKILKFQEFLTELAHMAAEENDQDSIVRAQRMAIDYCRLFVGIVGNAEVPLKEKVGAIRTFARSNEINACWAGYPLRSLPIQQRVFHWMILHERYGVALLLNKVRQLVKKGMQNTNGSEKRG